MPTQRKQLREVEKEYGVVWSEVVEVFGWPSGVVGAWRYESMGGAFCLPF